MDAKLTFVPHINKILSKAYRHMGFILRVTKPFKNSLIYKILYYSYIRSHLDFASTVWSPHYKKHSGRIESLQRKFIKCLEFRVGSEYINYETSLSIYNIPLLFKVVKSVMLYSYIKLFTIQLTRPKFLTILVLECPADRKEVFEGETFLIQLLLKLVTLVILTLEDHVYFIINSLVIQIRSIVH